jgi:hypothetical protein
MNKCSTHCTVSIQITAKFFLLKTTEWMCWLLKLMSSPQQNYLHCTTDQVSHFLKSLIEQTAMFMSNHINVKQTVMLTSKYTNMKQTLMLMR